METIADIKNKIVQLKADAAELDVIQGNKHGACMMFCAVPSAANLSWVNTGQPPANANLAPAAVITSLGGGIWGTQTTYAEIYNDAPSWIWAGGSHYDPNRGAAKGPFLLVKTFTSATATTATLKFTCDNEAKVWLNGVHLGTAHYWSRLSVAHNVPVRAGENVLTAVVYNLEDFGAGAFVAVLKTAGGTVLAKTDDSWKYLV